jgi:hypothetical protein
MHMLSSCCGGQVVSLLSLVARSLAFSLDHG